MYQSVHLCFVCLLSVWCLHTLTLCGWGIRAIKTFGINSPKAQETLIKTRVNQARCSKEDLRGGEKAKKYCGWYQSDQDATSQTWLNIIKLTLSLCTSKNISRLYYKNIFLSLLKHFLTVHHFLSFRYWASHRNRAFMHLFKQEVLVQIWTSLKSFGTSPNRNQKLPESTDENTHCVRTRYTHFGEIGFDRQGTPQCERMISPSKSSPTLQFEAHSRIFVKGRLEKQHFRGWGGGERRRFKMMMIW